MSTLEERLKEVWEKYRGLADSLKALQEQVRQFNAEASPLGVDSAYLNPPSSPQIERLRDIDLLLVTRKHFDSAE